MKNIHLLIFSLSYVIVLQLTSYTNNKTNSKEEKVLEKQLLRAHSISNEVTTIRYYPYDKEDLEVSIALLDSILKKTSTPLSMILTVGLKLFSEISNDTITYIF